jgi:hypothetical protein
MNRTSIAMGISLATCALTVTGERDAAACGGCFHPPTQVASDITDERMLLAVSTVQSTLYDQLRYAGSPSSFAWVLPIHGTVDVGLSADVLFDSVDVLTETQIVSPTPPCPPPPPNCFFASGASSGTASGGPVSAPVVTVTKQENVGPYATVQLHSTDATALDNWLAQNGYTIPAAVKPVIAQYLAEGFDFLAMKLLPNQGVQAMRPVRVTTPGASLSLPLRMAAVGTGPSVGITIWVVSDGRYEPQNFPFFTIDASQLVWDWTTSSSNYTTLRARNEAALGGAGWEVESSLTLNQQLITSVILSGGRYYGNRGFGGPISLPPASATEDYLPIGSADAGADGGSYRTAEEVRTADIAALFAGLPQPNVRVTRIRSDIAHAAMTKDFVLQASADQSELSNIRQVTQSVNFNVATQCPNYSFCAAASSGSPSVVDASVGVSGSTAVTGASTGTGATAVSGAIPGTSGSATSGDVGTSGSAASGDVGTSGSAASGASINVGVSAGASTAGATPGSTSPGGVASNSSAGGGGGCAASSPPRGGAAGLGALAGMMGLIAARAFRARRRGRSS